MWQEEGKTEAAFAQTGTEVVIKNMLTSRRPGPPILPKEGLGFTAPAAATERPLPSWLTQQDITYYASKFEKTGFAGGLNYYRNLNT